MIKAATANITFKLDFLIVKPFEMSQRHSLELIIVHLNLNFEVATHDLTLSSISGTLLRVKMQLLLVAPVKLSRTLCRPRNVLNHNLAPLARINPPASESVPRNLTSSSSVFQQIASASVPLIWWTSLGAAVGWPVVGPLAHSAHPLVNYATL